MSLGWNLIQEESIQHEDLKDKMQEQSLFLAEDEFSNFRNALDLKSVKVMKLPKLRLGKPTML